MLRPKKRISKRELKEDALITGYVKATGYYEQNKKSIQYGVLGVIAVVVVLFVYLNNRSTNDRVAMTELGKVYSLYDNSQFQLAIDGVPERNISGLKAIVDNYGGTHSGELARFYLANSYFNLEKYDEALAQFEEFSADGEELVVSRLAGIAACEEAKGLHGDAAENFEKAATKFSGNVNVPENLYHAARNYAKAGNKERALDIYKKIKKDHSKSTYARDVDRYIAQLSV
ncbi:MAG: tetratricopeptide repeat protein [Bacteroidota bacterium]